MDTLNGAGPFTVFAPTNAAFEKIPAETRNGLMQPDQRDALTGILTYHVVPGRVDAAALTQQIDAGGGSATLTTVQGGTLTATVVDGTVTLTDEAGNTSKVVMADVAASNGIIHAIDTVVMPN
ncbi:MAG: fasciclin domain-containing protein [Brevundimonas sp.]|uniref:fasciclin domain-containing protein n=1 Tax=Brevundimonas sp. TaxID=1871086 RepID=UPI00300136CB